MADTDSDVRNPVATQRFLELVEAMGAARDHRRGWKREVADVMGLAPSHLSKILVGERGVGIDLVYIMRVVGSDDFDIVLLGKLK